MFPKNQVVETLNRVEFVQLVDAMWKQTAVKSNLDRVQKRFLKIKHSFRKKTKKVLNGTTI